MYGHEFKDFKEAIDRLDEIAKRCISSSNFNRVSMILIDSFAQSRLAMYIHKETTTIKEFRERFVDGKNMFHFHFDTFRDFFVRFNKHGITEKDPGTETITLTTKGEAYARKALEASITDLERALIKHPRYMQRIMDMDCPNFHVNIKKKCLHCKHDVEYDGKYLPSNRGEPFCDLHHVFITDVEEFMYCDDFEEEPSYWLNPPIMEFDGEIFWTWDAMPKKKDGSPHQPEPCPHGSIGKCSICGNQEKEKGNDDHE